MPREIEPSVNQKEFLLAALAEGKRLDGRLPLEMRKIELEFGEEMGWCTCHLGKTSCVPFPPGCFIPSPVRSSAERNV